MTDTKTSFKWRKPRLIHFLIALLLAILIVDRGAAWLYEPKPGSKDIILYTTVWCPYCESLRTYLKGYDIPYIERDVEKSLSGTLGWWTLGRGRGVPISVIGEQVVRGYDLAKINAALRELGYSIQNPERDTASAEADYLFATTTGGGAATRPAAGECAPAEDFKAFYISFKADDEFRIQRTRFPLRKRVLSGSKPYLTTDEVVEIEENQVLTGQEFVYLDHELLEAGGYYETYGPHGESLMEVTVSPEGSADPLTIHKFQKTSGCWFLTELVSYEYFGSMMILK